jgi:hypothetical protein
MAVGYGIPEEILNIAHERPLMYCLIAAPNQKVTGILPKHLDVTPKYNIRILRINIIHAHKLTLNTRAPVPTNSVSLHTARKIFIYFSLLITCVNTPSRRMNSFWHLLMSFQMQ